MLNAVTNPAKINGIDYLTVLDSEALTDALRQHTLLLYFLLPLNPGLSVQNIRIDGGTRIAPVRPVWAHKAGQIPAGVVSQEEAAWYATLPNYDHILVIRVDRAGDFSRYKLSLRERAASDKLPANFDELLSEVDFSFKVECPSALDCRTLPACPPLQRVEPAIDYLAKDYDSFRRQMLDRLHLLLPAFQPHPADATTVLVELLAYTGDDLSYYQDAVATEAYLGTARRRTSIRRHTKLLDYALNDGRNARAWVHVDLEGAASLQLRRGTVIRIGSKRDETVVIDLSAYAAEPADDAIVFETMHAVTLWKSHSPIEIYTWGELQCCLPQGATRATLVDDPAGTLHLQKGDFLLFEEVKSPTDGLPVNANPERRHVVRITGLKKGHDTLKNVDVLEVEWGIEDALSFPLYLSVRLADNRDVTSVSVARGNIVLTDHGRTIAADKLDPPEVPKNARYKSCLTRGPLTFAEDVDLRPLTLADDADSEPVRLSAQAIMERKDSRPFAQVTLTDQEGTLWTANDDLLEADEYDPLFVVETEDDGTAALRFGDGVDGRQPEANVKFAATYRIGNGARGNVGRDSLRDIVGLFSGLTLRVRNPLPARGGRDPESIEQAVLFAPDAFRVQERAVTEPDYAVIAQRDARVQKAAATFRWTGSWHTVFTSVDRRGGEGPDPVLQEDLLRRLNGYRMAGIDLEMRPPRYLPLDILARICVKNGYFRAQIFRSLMAVFHNRTGADGRPGFFHPDQFTFGDALYLSRLYQVIMDVAGIDSADVTTFQVWGRLPNDELPKGVIQPAPDEILRLDNDRNFPENGRIQFDLVGGL